MNKLEAQRQEEQAKKEALDKKLKDYQQQQEEEKKRKEDERQQAALAPDKEKIALYIRGIVEIINSTRPELKNEELQSSLDKMCRDVGNLLEQQNPDNY